MKLSLLLAALFLTGTTTVQAGYVNGYTRDNGTYVQPYYRSNPDSTPYNNINPPTVYKPTVPKF